MARIYLNIPQLTACGSCIKLPHSFSARQMVAGFLVLVLLVFLLFCMIELYAVSHHSNIHVVTEPHHKIKGNPDTAEVDFGPNVHYGIVIDCGSSGSRVFVYFWPPHSGNPQDLLNIQQLMDKKGNPVVMKITPGLDTFKDNPGAASDYISPLLRFAGSYIPQDRHKETQLFILATAGMRMIPVISQKAILNNLITEIPKKFEYVVSENNMEVITGKTEGVYAWIAVNYVLQKFAHGEEDHPLIAVEMPDSRDLREKTTHIRRRTVGMLDMGGGSMQIAFELTSASTSIPPTRMAEFNLGCQNSDLDHSYRVYINSFLGYGANEARERYEDLLLTTAAHLNGTGASDKQDSLSGALAHHHKKLVLSDPCLPVGLHLDSTDDKGHTHHFKGTGDYQQCRDTLIPLLNQSVPCEKQYCSMEGVHQPDIPFLKSEFYGFSEFWYTSEDVFRMGGVYNSKKFDEEAEKFCKTEWSTLMQWYEKKLFPHADENRFRMQCFKAAWLSTLLHKGLHFPRSYKHLRSVQHINHREVQWTLGALLHRTRYLPLREMETFKSSHHFKPSWTYKRSWALRNEFVILFCVILVFLAVILYTKRFRLCRSQRLDMTRVPSMSYFMVDADQVEQGIRTKTYS